MGQVPVGCPLGQGRGQRDKRVLTWWDRVWDRWVSRNGTTGPHIVWDCPIPMRTILNIQRKNGPAGTPRERRDTGGGRRSQRTPPRGSGTRGARGSWQGGGESKDAGAFNCSYMYRWTFPGPCVMGDPARERVP